MSRLTRFILLILGSYLAPLGLLYLFVRIGVFGWLVFGTFIVYVGWKYERNTTEFHGTLSQERMDRATEEYIEHGREVIEKRGRSE